MVVAVGTLHLDTEEDAARLCAEPYPIQIVISDGLSADAVHHNLPDLLPPLLDGLHARALAHGVPILVRYGRVKLAEELQAKLGAQLVVMLIGERPGGDVQASRSLSAYLAYSPHCAPASATIAARSGLEYSVISNIYSGGLPPLEAAAVLVDKISQIFAQGAAGNRLEELLTQQG